MYRVLFLLTLVFVVNASLAPLHTTRDKIQDEYIVVLKEGEDVDTDIYAIQKRLGDLKLKFEMKHKYRKVINAFAASLSKKAVEMIRNLSSVEYVEEDGIVRIRDVGSWGIDRVNQRYLPLDGDADFYTGDGTGAHVYIIDTGLNPNHVDFGGRATQDYGYEDCNGHGTHCAGTIGSYTYGIATGAMLHGVTVLDCYGAGTVSDIIAGCDYVAQNAKRPAVASLSLGGGPSPAFDDAIRGMIDANITVSVAAGNDNTNACNYSPARVPEAITVGATENTDVRSYFSNYGECVNIFAPGTDITSTWYTGNRATNTLSGTSMACPHVAGIAALHLANYPSMKPSEVANMIYYDATPFIIVDPQGPYNLLVYAE